MPMDHNAEQPKPEGKLRNPMNTGRWWASVIGLGVLGPVARIWIFPVFEEDTLKGVMFTVAAAVAYIVGVLALTWLIDGFKEERFPPSTPGRP